MVTDVIFNPISLLNRIKKASTDSELMELYGEGNGYRYAANKTRRRWNEAIDAGRKRIHQDARAEIESKHKPKPKPKPKPRPMSKRENK